MKVPIIAEREEISGEQGDLHNDDDPTRWPQRGCRVIALVPKVQRDTKLDAVAVLGIFLGYKECVVGARVGKLDKRGEAKSYYLD